MSNHALLSSALLAGAAALVSTGCAAPADVAPPKPHQLVIFAINDFHGNIQADSPVPQMLRLPDAKAAQAAGGIAYLATALKTLRADKPGSVLVAAGDFIGASPQASSLLADEPSLAAFAELDVTASALGNHELDAGFEEFKRKAAGACPGSGCPWPGYKGVPFPFLAANLFDAQTGKRLLPAYVIKEMDGIPVAFVGAITAQTPAMSMARNMKGLRFADEADSLNALVPELRAKGAKVLVAVMHEGTSYLGEANVPDYDCGDVRGRGVEILQRLDPAYALVIGGHSHRAYACKVGGRLLTQAGSFGGWVTEVDLQVDGAGKVLDAQAVNHPVLQSRYAPDPHFAALAAQAAQLTAAARNKPVATLRQSLHRTPSGQFGDAPLGNLIADAQLAAARKEGPVDLAFINLGGIRKDLNISAGRPVTVSDLFSIQPFNNELVALTMSGAQLRDVLQRGLPKSDAQQPRLLQASYTLRYDWYRGSDGLAQIGDVRVDGKPLDPARDYRVVVNAFLADGAQAPFGQGRDRTVVGIDLDALIDYLSEHPEAAEHVQAGRILRRGDAAPPGK